MLTGLFLRSFLRHTILHMWGGMFCGILRDGQGAKYYELQATTSFARWLESQGRAGEVQTVLAEIYGWFTEGFDTPALREAKALLDELNNKPSAPRRSNKSRKDR